MRRLPARLPLLASAVAAGQPHPCAVGVSRHTYYWGDNAVGQLGDGSNLSSTVPVCVAGGHDFEVISSGGRHRTRALDGAREVWCWRENFFGQLGDDTTPSSNLLDTAATARRSRDRREEGVRTRRDEDDPTHRTPDEGRSNMMRSVVGAPPGPLGASSVVALFVIAMAAGCGDAAPPSEPPVGRADAHVHLSEGPATELDSLIHHGITVVRDCGGDPGELVSLRDEIDSGRRRARSRAP